MTIARDAEAELTRDRELAVRVRRRAPTARRAPAATAARERAAASCSIGGGRRLGRRLRTDGRWNHQARLVAFDVGAGRTSVLQRNRRRDAAAAEPPLPAPARRALEVDDQPVRVVEREDAVARLRHCMSITTRVVFCGMPSEPDLRHRLVRELERRIEQRRRSGRASFRSKNTRRGLSSRSWW